MRSRDIKYFISTCLRPKGTKYDEVVTHREGLQTKNSPNPLSVYERSRNKLKTYLHYHNAYGHKTY